ncbi:MAG: M15 family metallopeptidase [Flavobacteriaceae bacterium]
MMHKGLFFIGWLFLLSSVGAQELEIDNALLLGKKELIGGEDYVLLPPAAEHFEAMKLAAAKDSIAIKIVSSFRSYETQKKIWNRKYNAFIEQGFSPIQAIDKIIEYSTLPGTSRHHWGTDIDIIDGNMKVDGDVLLTKHFHQGPYQKLRLWLEKHAYTYGFILVYTKDSSRKGFLYEPWHYSYKPLSVSILKQYVEKNLLSKVTKDSLLLGHEYLSSDFINRYFNENILGIHPALK